MEEKELSFEELYILRYDSIVLYCQKRLGTSRFNAEDIANETFETVYKKWNKLSTHTYKGMSVFIIKTAEYKIKEYLRKSKNESLNEPFDDMNLLHNKYDESENSFFRDAIREITEQLSCEDRIWFERLFIEENKIEDLSAKFNISINALYIKKNRIKTKIKKVLKKSGRIN